MKGWYGWRHNGKTQAANLTGEEAVILPGEIHTPGECYILPETSTTPGNILQHRERYTIRTLSYYTGSHITPDTFTLPETSTAADTFIYRETFTLPGTFHSAPETSTALGEFYTPAEYFIFYGRHFILYQRHFILPENFHTGRHSLHRETYYTGRHITPESFIPETFDILQQRETSLFYRRHSYTGNILFYSTGRHFILHRRLSYPGGIHSIHKHFIYPNFHAGRLLQHVPFTAQP